MKRILIIATLAILFIPNSVMAQGKVSIEITDMNSEPLRKKMSASATALVSELNRAYFANARPNLSKINMTNDARQNVLQIWDNSPYRCIETELYLRSLTTNGGFQVRNLPFIVKEGNENQDVVINFSKTGAIDAFYFAIENHRYQAIMQAKNSITDMRRRQMILDFVENFRTAYNRKDLPMIDAMYSDNALIITGNIYRTSPNEITGIPEEKIQYFKSNKQEYMSKLKRVFTANKYINIGFDEISVAQHPKHNNIYGVTLKQAWRTSNYNDDGWLFLAIHFETENEMIVDVRTWQPYMLNGEILPAHERFTLGDLEF